MHIHILSVQNRSVLHPNVVCSCTCCNMQFLCKIWAKMQNLLNRKSTYLAFLFVQHSAHVSYSMACNIMVTHDSVGGSYFRWCILIVCQHCFSMFLGLCIYVYIYSVCIAAIDIPFLCKRLHALMVNSSSAWVYVLLSVPLSMQLHLSSLIRIAASFLDVTGPCVVYSYFKYCRCLES